jgi:hypothetical protein
MPLSRACDHRVGFRACEQGRVQVQVQVCVSVCACVLRARVHLCGYGLIEFVGGGNDLL